MYVLHVLHDVCEGSEQRGHSWVRGRKGKHIALTLMVYGMKVTTVMLISTGVDGVTKVYLF